MNETLEEMARALFKSWFVDFDPVRAKMEGRWRRGESLPGLPADLYDLFPDRLVDSELGEIPEGWGVKEWGKYLPMDDRTKEESPKLDQRPMVQSAQIFEGPWLSHKAGELDSLSSLNPEVTFPQPGQIAHCKMIHRPTEVVALYGATAGDSAIYRSFPIYN